MHQRLTAVFQKIGCEYEIIFVNDNSPDNAKEVLTELAARDPKVVVINHSRNFGAQSALPAVCVSRQGTRSCCWMAIYRIPRS